MPQFFCWIWKNWIVASGWTAENANINRCALLKVLIKTWCRARCCWFFVWIIQTEAMASMNGKMMTPKTSIKFLSAEGNHLHRLLTTAARFSFKFAHLNTLYDPQNPAHFRYFIGSGYALSGFGRHYYTKRFSPEDHASLNDGQVELTVFYNRPFKRAEKFLAGWFLTEKFGAPVPTGNVVWNQCWFEVRLGHAKSRPLFFMDNSMLKPAGDLQQQHPPGVLTTIAKLPQRWVWCVESWSASCWTNSNHRAIHHHHRQNRKWLPTEFGLG